MNLPLLHLKAGARHALIVTDHMQLGRDLGSLLSLLICLLRRVPGQLLGLISIFNFPQLQSRERVDAFIKFFLSLRYSPVLVTGRSDLDTESTQA